ncbi:MAG: acyl-CoA reductase-like NAD-dependent aldehyde dehydrogenase [Planctomycetota bacterium]|jgi:acyl-CoA reductase-like NAD-dependent aldehyde dehydrogenase
MQHENLINGRLHPSRSAGRFTWRAALPPCEELGDFPRSGPEEVDVARDSLARGARPWWKRRHVDRRQLVERGLARFRAAALSESSRLAAGFGLDADEFELELRRAVTAGTSAARRARPCPPGVALLMPDWRVHTESLLTNLATILVEGRVLLLTSDERAPYLPQLLIEELLDVGLPEDSLALLHAPNDEARSVAVSSGIERLCAWGDLDRIASLRRVAAGASVSSQALHLHRACSDRLPRGADPEDAAVEVLERAFGRCSTFSGTRGGQLSTLFVPEGDFSAFSEALVEVMSKDRAYLEPLPFLDREGPAKARKAWTLGLDEGATLVLGGEVRGAGGRQIQPTLMTNGAAHMRIARRVEPTPVLLLCRERSKRGVVRVEDE